MKKMILTLIGVFFLSNTSAGEITSVLEGPFKIEPKVIKVIHRNAITGVMSALFEEETLSRIHLNLDEPVMGETTFKSKEQAMHAVHSDTLSQMIFIFKLEGPTHKWYFVTVANLVEVENLETAFSGSIYKVRAKMEDILDLVKDGLTDVPSKWKRVGSVDLSDF